MAGHLAADPRDWTADQLEKLIAAAIKAGDMEAVPRLLVILAAKDADRAAMIYDGLRAVLELQSAD